MLTNPNPQEGAEAVNSFNALYSRMDSVLWCLSRHTRTDLVAGISSPRVEAVVWTVRSWWGVQGVRTETKVQMAQALAQMPWTDDVFENPVTDGRHPAIVAEDLVTTLADRTMKLGGARRELSLASKVLHWLLPWRVPAYDKLVREQLGVADHPQAYRDVARGVFKLARESESWPTSSRGEIGPLSTLRALDKYLWWSGGGNAGTAVIDKSPNDKLYAVGINPSECVDRTP